MGRVVLDTEELLEMVELLAGAVAVASSELAQLSDTLEPGEWPLPDHLKLERQQLAAFVETVGQMKPEARNAFRVTLAKAKQQEAYGWAEMSVPVNRDVVRVLDAAFEVLRRRSIFHVEYRDAVWALLMADAPGGC